MTFRCSESARARGDDPAGTASSVRRFILVEHPGPWGVSAVLDAPMADGVRRHLAVAGSRTLLIRKHRRRGRHGVHVLVADVAGRTLRGTVLDSIEQVTDLDLAGDDWATAYDRPFLGVCTHGRHDACCAERGRPVAAALNDVDPEATWEVSHMGGDRFAANVLALPVGLYYGRVEAENAEALVTATREGRMLLDLARGRTDLPMPAQYAELHLRRELGLDRIDDVRLTGRDGIAWTFAANGRAHRVVVDLTEGERELLTCGAQRPNAVPMFRARTLPGK